MNAEAKLDIPAMIAFIDAEFRHQFRNVIDQITLPIPQRVDQFTCWPGLSVVASADNGRRVELNFRNNPSKLREGEYVYVNAMTVEPKDVISGPEGVIRKLDHETKTVVIEPAYQQARRFERRFRIDDRVVLDQTLPAAHFGRDLPVLALRILNGEFGQHPRIKRIRALLEGREGPRASGDRSLFNAGDDSFLSQLTEAQREALTAAIENDFALIQGPPGTGKTYILGLLIREFVRRGKSVGVCAFTHQGINNVLNECLQYEDIPEVVKLGAPGTWNRDPDHPRLNLNPRPAAFFKQKNRPAVTGFTQHAAFGPLARGLEGAIGDSLQDRFDVLVFDEAGQLTISAAAMAMLQADRFVFAGDHQQLPPVVATVRPGFGPGISVFRHLVELAKQPSTMLDRSFRLNDELVSFPSEEFYSGKLQSSASAAGRRLNIQLPDHDAESRLSLLDPKRPSQLALIRHEGRGQESPEEAALAACLACDAMAFGVPPEEIAIIAPHRRQNVKIRENLARLGHRGSHPVVDTVERIQGQERDLIILSMTLSDPDVMARELQFLFLPNRVNVSLTRARRKLVVIASFEFFRALPRPYALSAAGPSPLQSVNVLKRWYFRHKPFAKEATMMAAEAAEEILAPQPSPAEEAG